MIVHLFNSSSVSGPERLVLPALASVRDHVVVINLREERIDHLRESDPLEEYARSLNLDYRDVLVGGHWDYVAVRDLRVLLKRLEPALVHAHDVKASAYLLLARQPAQSNRFQMVSTHHGVHGRPDWKTRFYEWVYRRHLLNSFDRVLCVSSADYAYLKRSGVTADRLRFHLNGIDGHEVDISRRWEETQSLRARWLPLDDDRNRLFLFGVVGRLSAEKDHVRLLRVLSHLHRLPCEKDWRCLIFGTGPLEKKLQQKAREWGLENRVQWMGFRKDIGNELAGLDLVLSFSKAEGLPINLIEAGWAGTPVMCTKVGGVSDLIPDERFGNLVPPEESPMESAARLKECLSREGHVRLRDQAICFQKRVAAEFTQTQWLQRLKELYAELKVDFAGSNVKPIGWPRLGDSGNGGLSERLQTTFFTRIMLSQTGRIADIRGWNQNGFRILMYHNFHLTHPDAQSALAKQCAYIKSLYHVVSLMDIAKSLREHTPLPPNALAVTVDDGYRDFLCNGFPVFRAHQIPVTVFLATAFIDGHSWMWWDQIRFILERTLRLSFEISLTSERSSPALFPLSTKENRNQAISDLTEALKRISNGERLKVLKDLPDLLDVKLPPSPPPRLAPLEWSEVRYLAENGVDFGAHTVTHPILSSIQDPAELDAEIIGSKRRIEEELGRPVLHFGYPNGRREDVNDQTFKLLQEGCFQTAVTAEKGVNFQGAHPFWLRRIGVDPMMSKFNFEALLAGLGGSRSKQVPLSLAGH